MSGGEAHGGHCGCGEGPRTSWELGESWELTGRPGRARTCAPARLRGALRGGPEDELGAPESGTPQGRAAAPSQAAH
eukprot:12113985-Alexandrium_andersonii.AAC.1